MNVYFVHLRASMCLVLAAFVLPALLSAGELRTTINSLSKTCVGEELTVNATVEDFNAFYAVHNVVTTVKVIQGATVVATKTLSPFDLTPKQVKPLTIATGWMPTAAGAYTVDVSADGTDDINGPQAAQAPLTVCANTPCPDRPTASDKVIYLGAGSSGSVTYSTPRPECCFELKLTIVTGRDVITTKSPESWTTLTSSLPVSVAIDRSKWKADYLTVRLDWRSCDRKKSGSDYILIRNGDKPQASAPQTPPPGVTSGQTPHAGTDGDPVITATREFTFPVAAVDAEALSAVPVSMTRYYASLGPAGVAKEDGFGPGWSSPFDWFVVFGDGEAYVYAPKNVVHRFRRENSTWVRDWPKSGAYSFAQANDSTLVFGDLENSMVVGFNPNGRLRFFDNTNGSRNTVQYDGMFMSAVRTPSGRGLTFIRDSVGLITEVSNGIGTVSYGYTNGILTSFTDATGKNTTQYNYQSGSSFLTSWRSPEGRTPFTLTYDPTGHVTSQDFGDGFTINFAQVGSVTTMTYPLGIKKTHTHDAQQRLTEMTNATGGTASLGYDLNSNRNSVKDMEGGTVARMYANGLLSSETLANNTKLNVSYTARPFMGLTMQDLKSIEVVNGPSYTPGTNARGETYTYDADGLVATTTSAAGATTSYTRNVAGYITEEKLNSASVAQYSYDLNSDVTSVNRNGAITSYIYDKDREVRSVTNAVNRTWTLDRDSRDRVTQAKSPSGAAIKYTWMGPLMTGLELGDGQKYTFTPDANGHASSTTNALGQAWSIASDNEGLPKKLTTPGNATWTYQTNPFGNVTGYTSPLGRTWNYEYDVSGLLSSLREPDGVVTATQRSPDLRSGTTTVNGAMQFGYNFSLPSATNERTTYTDGNGYAWMRSAFLDMNVLRFTSPLGQVTSVRSSADGSIAGVDYPNGTSATFLRNGKNTTIQVGSESMSWTVDNVGKPTKVGSDNITYGPSGRAEKMNGVTASRSVGGRVTGFSIGTTATAKYTYDARGYVNGIEDQLGGKTTVVYDERGRLAKYDCPGGYSLNYTYNNDDQIVRAANSYGWSLAYGRDNAGRIVSIDRSDNVPLTPMAMPVDMPITFDKDGRIQTGTYDGYGNLKSMTGSSISLSYGAFGVKSFEKGALKYNVALDDYGYPKTVDQSGQTSTITMNPMTDAWSPIRISSPSSTWTFVELPNGVILYGINDQNQRRYFDNDGLGNVVAERDESGMVMGSRLLTPYGVTVGKTGTPGPLGYQGALGGLSFADDKLTSLGKNYYSPDLGRFTNGIGLVPGYPLNLDPRRENAQVFTYDPFGSALGRSDQFATSDALRAKCTINAEDFNPTTNYQRQYGNDQWGSFQPNSSFNLFGLDQNLVLQLMGVGSRGYAPPMMPYKPIRVRPYDALSDHVFKVESQPYDSLTDLFEDLFPPLTTPTLPTPPKTDLQPKRETQKKK